MHQQVMDKIGQLAEICQRRQVRRLALFGSATRSQFDPHTSDVDLLVDFESASPARHADNFFGLQDDLECLFGSPVELVESKAIRNPIFQKVVEETKVTLYDAGRSS